MLLQVGLQFGYLRQCLSLAFFQFSSISSFCLQLGRERFIVRLQRADLRSLPGALLSQPMFSVVQCFDLLSRVRQRVLKLSDTLFLIDQFLLVIR